MALSLEPDQFDRGQSGLLDVLDEDDDDDENPSRPMLEVGIASDFVSPARHSHLAGTDEATAQRWEYEDKMAVLGLVLGSEFSKPGA